MVGDDTCSYIDLAGGKTNSVDFAVLIFLDENSRRVGLGLFTSNPTIPDRLDILLSRIPPAKPELPEKESATTLVDVLKETRGIVATTLTVLVPERQLK